MVLLSINKISFIFKSETYFVGSQKNRLNDLILLGTNKIYVVKILIFQQLNCLCLCLFLLLDFPAHLFTALCRSRYLSFLCSVNSLWVFSTLSLFLSSLTVRLTSEKTLSTSSVLSGNVIAVKQSFSILGQISPAIGLRCLIILSIALGPIFTVSSTSDKCQITWSHSAKTVRVHLVVFC